MLSSPKELIELAAQLPVGRIARTRIAPTPSGLLHEGNAVNFLLTWAIARANGAKVLLRIDDLDAERVRPEYVEDIFRSLEWLGIDWDEGPTDGADLERNWSQHRRMEHYQHAVAQLKECGLLYACSCSRKDIAALTNDGVYPGTCRDRDLPFNELEVAWRLWLNEAAKETWSDLSGKQITIDLATSLGDPVIRQKNGRPAYQIASLMDDLEFQVDMIVRGEDLIGSTAYQLQIAALMENRAFGEVQFMHHPLITEANGEKLSKSSGSTSLFAMRDSGRSSADLQRHAADLLRTII